jgi:hypothetical protein
VADGRGSAATLPAARELRAWLDAQVDRERGVVRLEDALLGGRYARYFVFRLRFFLLRTLVAAIVHAIRVALLFASFARDEFLVIVLVGAAAAIAGDAWWGALERMRTRIRRLQRTGGAHLAPREIGAWLTLSVRLTGIGLGLAGIGFAWAVALSRDGLDAADAMVVAIVGGAALDLVVRTFHSGAYALRRVYRPLPSLVAVDAVSLGALLVLSPLVGLWAFPVADVLSTATVLAISLRYTGRTYRTLGFPAFRALLARRDPPPPRRVLRTAVAPATAAGLVGLDGLVLLAVVAAGVSDPATGGALVALLAALGPVIRAGFEWARLLYFDLIRLGVPLLAVVRSAFDRAVLGLAVVMGGATWLIAAGVGAAIMGVRDVGLILALLPFFVTRSILAGAQMRAFAGGAFRRLALVGVGGLVAFGLALVLAADVEARLLVLSAILAVSSWSLVALPPPESQEERVLPLAEWLGRLRRRPAAVIVTVARLDRRATERGIPRERRAAEQWRQREVARRVGREVQHHGGATTWLEPGTLAWFLPAGSADGAPSTVNGAAGRRDRVANGTWVVPIAGGLIDAPPRWERFLDGSAAARHVAALDLGIDLDDAPTPLAGLLDRFALAFPSGIVWRPRTPPPAALAALTSRERAIALRAALRFAHDLRSQGSEGRFDVTADADEGGIRAVFLVPRRASARVVRGWHALLRTRALREALGEGGAREGYPVPGP